MTVYKVHREENIEAKTFAEACDKLLEDNGGISFDFETEEEARAAYNAIELSKPKDLGDGLKWYDGKYLRKALSCEESEDLEEAFYSAIAYEGLAADISTK